MTIRSLPALSRLLAIAVAASFLGTAAHADELQDKVVAAARATAAADRYAFRRTLMIERTGAARKTIVEQFDPRRPAPERWSIISIDGSPPTPKDIAGARKRKGGLRPAYAEIAKWFGSTATRSEVAGGYVYRFAAMPAGTIKLGSHDASADTQAEALVNTRGATPFVERVRLTSTKPVRFMLVASLSAMTIDQRYRQLADGDVVPSDQTSSMKGSMLGKSGEMRSSVSYAEVRAVR